MNKFFLNKEHAMRVLKSDARYFYVYGIVIAVFASYLSISELNASYVALFVTGALLVLPAYLAVTLQSRVAASVLLFFTIAQLVGALYVFELSVNGVLNTLFVFALVFLALRMLFASIRLNRRDTMSS